MKEDPTDALNRLDVLSYLVKYRRDRAAKLEEGFRQVDVARKMGIGQPALSEFERGGTSPRMETVQRYARALGLELVFVVRGSEDAD